MDRIVAVDSKSRDGPDEVEAWFRQAGIEMTFPRQYAHLLTYDIVDFEGRRVPKLVFFNSQKNAVAQILVLRNEKFPHVGRLAVEHHDNTAPLIEEGPDCIYVVFFAGGGRDAFADLVTN
jgi:hypothetical protein